MKCLLIVYDDAHDDYVRCPWCNTPLRYSEEHDGVFCPEEQDGYATKGRDSSLRHRFVITR